MRSSSPGSSRRAVTRPAPFRPPPTEGFSDRDLLLIGAGGSWFAAAAFGLMASLPVVASGGLSGGREKALVAPFILSLALAIQLVGFYAIWKTFRFAMGLATCAYGLAAIGFFLFGSLLLIGGWGTLLYMAGLVLLGVLFILEGVTYIVAQNVLGTPGSVVMVGVLFIVGGSLTASILLTYLGGWFTMVPAAIVGGLVFAGARVPPPRRKVSWGKVSERSMSPRP